MQPQLDRALVPLPLSAPIAPPRMNIRYATDFPTCNLACSYCIAGHGTAFAKKETNNWSPSRYNAVIDNIARLPFEINIRIGVAGEFFVSKVLVDGARRLSNAVNIYSINLITNLTLSLAQFDAVLRGYREDRLAVVASFHPEQIVDHEDWFHKAAEFSRRYDFAVVLVAFPDQLADIARYRARLQDVGVSVFVQPFRGPHDGKHYPADYSPEQRQVIRGLMYSRHDYEYLLNLKRPGLCNAGYRSIYVDAFGKVKPCGVGPYPYEIGDLTQGPELDLRLMPTPCPFRTCQCDTENINTVEFEGFYERTDRNQHRYQYRFRDLAALDPRFDEWDVEY